MSFSIAQIPLVRPWFRQSYLTSPIWRFAVGDVLVKDWKLSDGGKPPTGQMPAYPTSAIFIRDLTLNFGTESGFSEWMNEQKSKSKGGGAALSLGPFFLGGSYSSWQKHGKSESQSQYKYHDENGMSVAGMHSSALKSICIPWNSQNHRPTSRNGSSKGEPGKACFLPEQSNAINYFII